MEIKPPTNDIYTAISQNVPTQVKNDLASTPPFGWKISQILLAVITKMSDKLIFLDINGVKANTIKPDITNLQIGDTLKLQIDQLKPMPQFRVLSFEKANAGHIGHSPLITQALAQIRVQESAVSSLLKNVSYVANRPALKPSPLSANINAAVRDFLSIIPSPFAIKTAPHLKAQLQNSGLFVESKIKQEILQMMGNTSKNSESLLTSNIKNKLSLDIGAQLHRIALLIKTQLPSHIEQNNAAVSKAPLTYGKENQLQSQHAQKNQPPVKELASLQNISQRDEAMQSFLKNIESGISHLKQTQLQNLSENQAGRPLWLMELPIKDGQDIDILKLRISQDENAQATDQHKKIWNITLEFDFPELGKIKAHVKMQNENISTQFYSEQAKTLALFKDNLDFLRSRLNYNGLNVEKIECVQTSMGEQV
ncbi:MAG: flagellar hook-length control protein FliK [Woeseiaceae bacterium]